MVRNSPRHRIHSTVKRVPKLAEQIYEDLRRDIVSQRLEDGQRLPGEVSLCERFGVSRPILREALARLKLDGLLVARQGAGNFVHTPRPGELIRPLNKDRIPEILSGMDFRIGLEGEAAYRAAKRRTEEDLKAIMSASMEFDRVSNANEIGINTDFRFHLSVAHATHNRHFSDSLWAVHRTIGHEMTLLNLSARKSRSRVLEVQKEHNSIIDAIAARDCEAARSVMRKHISNSHDRIASLIDRKPER